MTFPACGSDGCCAVDESSGAFAYASRIHGEWTQDYYDQMGEFPRYDDQLDVFERVVAFYEADHPNELWDWADHEAAESLAKMCEGIEMEATRDDRIKLATKFREISLRRV